GVGLDAAGQDLLGEAQLLPVVGGRHPEPQQLGAVAGDDLLGGGHVAFRLRHLLAGAVDDEAVRDDGVVRRATLDGDAGEQCAVEPTAMLVAALEVDVGATAELGPPFHHRPPAAPGVEPDVEDVGLWAEGRPSAARARHPGRHQLGHRATEPGVRPLALEDVGDVRAQGLARNRLAAGRAEDRHHRYAPVTLPGHAPVGTGRDHVADALLPPGRFPAYARDLAEGTLAERRPLHADEPLLGGAEDDRVLASPAVRVAVLDRPRGQEGPRRPQALDDARVGVEDPRAGPLRNLGCEASVRVDRRQHLEAVAEPGLVVLVPVAGSGVDAARAAVEGDVVGEYDRHDALEPGMAAAATVEVAPATTGQRTGRVRRS